MHLKFKILKIFPVLYLLEIRKHYVLQFGFQKHQTLVTNVVNGFFSVGSVPLWSCVLCISLFPPEVLKASSVADPVLLQQKVEEVREKQRSSEYCDQLLQYIQSLWCKATIRCPVDYIKHLYFLIFDKSELNCLFIWSYKMLIAW